MDKQTIISILLGLLLAVTLTVSSKKEDESTIGDIPMMIVIAGIIVCIAIFVWNI